MYSSTRKKIVTTSIILGVLGIAGCVLAAVQANHLDATTFILLYAIGAFVGIGGFAAVAIALTIRPPVFDLDVDALPGPVSPVDATERKDD